MLESMRPVVFAGENSMVDLYVADGAVKIASASYWRCTWSAAGEGNGLFLWSDPVDGRDGPGVRLILADNIPLAETINTRFNRHFAGFGERGFAGIVPLPARFTQIPEGRRRHRVVAVAGSVTVELEWREASEGALTFFDNTSDPDQAYDVSTVICHCRHGAISIDGTNRPGRVIGNDDIIRHGGTGHEPGYRSAFVALSETWVQRDGPSRWA